MLQQALCILLPCLAASMSVRVPAVAAPSAPELDSDAEATSSFESFGSFGGFQSLGKMSGFEGFGDLDGQFDSSGFDRVFTGQNRRFDTGALEELPAPASQVAADRRSFHGVAASVAPRQYRPQPISSFAAAAAATSEQFHPQRRPFAAAAAPKQYRPQQSTFSATAVAAQPTYQVHPTAELEFPSSASYPSQTRPVAYTVAAAAPNRYPAKAVTASNAVQTRHSPLRLSTIHAGPSSRAAPSRSLGYQPQESSPVQSNKFQDEFQKQLGGGFGPGENHGFDFGPEGF